MEGSFKITRFWSSSISRENVDISWGSTKFSGFSSESVSVNAFLFLGFMFEEDIAGVAKFGAGKSLGELDSKNNTRNFSGFLCSSEHQLGFCVVDSKPKIICQGSHLHVTGSTSTSGPTIYRCRNIALARGHPARYL